MVRTKNLVLFGVSVAVLLSGCETVEESLQLRKPTARLMGVQFKDASLYGATLVFDVQIQNHYAFDLPLQRFDYVVSSQGQRFLAGFGQVQITVPAGGSQTVSLPASVDYLKTLKMLGGSVIGGRAIPYEAGLDLVIDTPRLGSITLPMETTGQLSLPAVSGSPE